MTPYEAHKKRWLKCTRCPLHETRSRVVLVRGKLPCDVLLVGEAPGQSEDALGKPFVGPAGKLLDRMIEDAGGNVQRIRLAFTNVVACIPYDEEGKKTSEPPEVAVRRCRSRLEELIAIARPSWVLGVGLVAEKQLKLQAHRDYRVKGIVHPAAVLRAVPAQQGLLYQKNVVIMSEVFESLIPF